MTVTLKMWEVTAG